MYIEKKLLLYRCDFTIVNNNNFPQPRVRVYWKTRQDTH